jgi:hypothetical protein
MSVMNRPDLEQVRQEFFDEIVEDFPVDDESFRRQRLDGVVKQKQCPVLRNAILALNRRQ